MNSNSLLHQNAVENLKISTLQFNKQLQDLLGNRMCYRRPPNFMVGFNNRLPQVISMTKGSGQKVHFENLPHNHSQGSQQFQAVHIPEVQKTGSM